MAVSEDGGAADVTIAGLGHLWRALRAPGLSGSQGRVTTYSVGMLTYMRAIPG